MDVGFEDRHLIETEARPELLDSFVQLMNVTFAGGMGPAFGLEIFGVASLGAGCAHGQAHVGYGLSLFGVDGERIHDSSAVVTDPESVDWAKADLSQVGWKLGRHEGKPGERRLAHPFSEAMRGMSPFARKWPPALDRWA